jgi:hypothetical protein
MHDSAGKPLNKNQGKKAQKVFQAQQIKYDKYNAARRVKSTLKDTVYAVTMEIIVLR